MASLHHPAEEVGIGAARVLRGELHVVGVDPRPADRGADQGEHIVPRDPQLFPDVEVRRRDEHVEPGALRGADRLTGQIDVAVVAARQRGDDRASHLGRDLAHAPVVALGRGRKAGLEDIHPQGVELPGKSQLLLGGEAVAGGLFAIAQGGIEDEDVGGSHMRFRFGEGERKSAADHRVRGAWCIRGRLCYCLMLLVSARREPLAHQ